MIPWMWFQIFQLSPTGMQTLTELWNGLVKGLGKTSGLTHDAIGNDLDEEKSNGKEVDLGVPIIVL